ncbi:MAG: YeeE/YedE family protein [Alphaproteobacteria bacterium]|nr:YeeE/YedE family protein [Alphaproteobacteria bacterium]
MAENAVRGVSSQRIILITGGGLATLLFAVIAADSPTRALLFMIGLAMGIALYHASFGFSGAYRNLLTKRDMTGVAAQIVMLIAAILLFAPILAQGNAFGHGVTGSIAPVGLSMGFGAFLFGIGMQLGSGCASGVLYTAGGGNVRTLLVLVFFCFGAFWGSLDIGWWQTLPGIGSVSLAKELGWEIALPLQIGALILIFFGLRLSGWSMRPITEWPNGLSWSSVLKGPWPLFISALLLALLNWATLLVAGHAWSITWAFTLWGAKIAALSGWDPATSGFWSGGFQQAALARSILGDTTSVMNIAVLLGALLAASIAGSFYKRLPPSPGPLVAAVVAGLLMGYGARLSYGCNIGAFFSGVASSSLHGWVWILCALPGNAVGIALRRPFRMDATQSVSST